MSFPDNPILSAIGQRLGFNRAPAPSLLPNLPNPTLQAISQNMQPSSDLSQMGVPNQYNSVMQKAASSNGVPVKILAGIAKHESGGTFDPNQTQIGGGMGRGMYQIDLGQHPDITEQQASDPTFSSNYAAKMLADSYKQYGNWDDAIKAYNAGNPYSQAIGYNGQPVYQLANQYLDKVKIAMGEK